MLVLKVAAPPGGSLVSLAPSKPELWLSCNYTTITTYFARCREELFKRDVDDMVPTHLSSSLFELVPLCIV